MRAGLKFEIKELADSGVFEGHAAAIGNVDLGFDRIEKGAFKRTIAHHKGAIPILWQHAHHEPIGIGMEMAEDAKGLKIKGQLIMEVQKAREAHALMKAGVVSGLSIGYEIPKGGSTFDRDTGIRHLKEIKLYEYSPVTFPMNERAKVTRVKDAIDILLPGLEESSPQYEDVLHYLEKAAQRFDALLQHSDPGSAHSDDAEPSKDRDSDSEILHSLDQIRQELRKATADLP